MIFLSGDDAIARFKVIKLFDDAGFFTIDLGDLTTSARGAAMSCRRAVDGGRSP